MNTVRCPHCGEDTPNTEAGMGYIRCEHCDEIFSSQNGQTWEVNAAPRGGIAARAVVDVNGVYIIAPAMV